MKTKNLISIALLFLSLFQLELPNISAQPKSDLQLPDLIPYRKGDKWGFCDKDKNIIILLKYDDVYKFKDGLAKVKLNGII